MPTLTAREYFKMRDEIEQMKQALHKIVDHGNDSQDDMVETAQTVLDKLYPDDTLHKWKRDANGEYCIYCFGRRETTDD